MSGHTASFSRTDSQMMARAIQLAKVGKYTTTPNPNVGCVICNSKGDVIGEGSHLKAGLAHAEINALKQAGGLAQDATVYVTLEPCSHYGKTPPCSDALIAAGVHRVVVAMEDPNPKVSGNGIAKLREAGIQVDIGLMQSEAGKLNPGFIKRHSTGMPFVQVKLAMSLDGKTALGNGVSKWITGAEARRDVQAHRAASCAILSGSGTVLSDDPSLNVRKAELPSWLEQLLTGELRQPKRFILDGKNQLQPGLKVLQPNQPAQVLNLSHNPGLPTHIGQTQVAAIDGKIDLNAALRVIAGHQVNQVWVEAGAKLAGALVNAKLVDELILYVAPKLMGDSAMDLLSLPAILAMEDVPKLQWQEITQVGNDLKLVCRFN